MNDDLISAIAADAATRVGAIPQPGWAAYDAAAHAARAAAEVLEVEHNTLLQNQPTIVAGETALQTYERMDMGSRTNRTIDAIVTHYRQIIAGCLAPAAHHTEGTP